MSGFDDTRSGIIFMGELDPTDVNADTFKDALSSLCTVYLDSSFDPGVMRDLLEEQARDVFSLPSDETADTAEDDDTYESERDALDRMRQEEAHHPTHVEFCYVIGSMDDFSSIEELRHAYKLECKDGEMGDSNWNIYRFSLPSGTTDDIALIVGRGYAFGSDWSRDHTLSFLVRLS